ncbi:MAG TPA: GAF domain-containing protein [Roseiflexaceae bacterium]|nr:GAF domain-containing protein [Roseiflexaceae bacterium]
MSIDSQRQASEIFDQPITDEAELRSQVLNNMLNVSTYLVSVLDPTELLTSLARRVVEVVPAVQAGLLWLQDQQQGAIQIKSLHGIDPGPDQALLDRLRLRLGEGLAGTVWQRGEPMLIEGRGRYQELVGRVGALALPDIRRLIEPLPRDVTAVLLPLRIGKQVIGVLELLNIGDGPPLHRQDLQVLQTFGNLAAGAINNAQLHAKMQAHQRRLEALGAIGAVVSMAADLDELLSNALDVLLRVVETQAGLLLLHDLSRSLLSVVAQRGLPGRFVELHHSVPVSGSPYEEVVRYGQAIARPLIAEDGEELLIEAGFNSCVYLPLLAGGTVVGVISMYGDETMRERVDVPALMTMGSQLGLAIANVRLYQDTRTERLKLSAVINSIAEGVVLCNREGRLVLANQSAMELLSVERIPVEQSLSEMPDFYAMRDLEGESLPVEQLPLARALSGEVFHDYRLLSHGASGIDTVLSFSGAPVYDDENNVDGAVVIFRDVTTSQKLERAKDDFLAVAAHELRSPLAAVRGYADLLVRREQRRGDEDSPELRGLNILAQQVTHMLRMVDNILDVSRIDAGQVSLQLQRVNLVPLIEQVIEQQRPTAGDRMLVLESDEPELSVVCDSLRIRQVLTNLVGNAIRYSPAATRVTVRIAIEPAGVIAARHPAYANKLADRDAQALMALIAVHDQGAGISEEQLGRLFKRYARGRERRGEGLGLGLYLSREFVARHGGDIWAESYEGQGSTFYVTLPLENEHTNGIENV